MSCRGLEEFADGYALAADEEFCGRMIFFVKGSYARQSLLATAAFHLNGDQCIAAL